MQKVLHFIILIFFITCGSNPDYQEVMVNKTVKVYSQDYHNEAENYFFKWKPPVGPSNQPVPFDLKNDILIFSPEIEGDYKIHLSITDISHEVISEEIFYYRAFAETLEVAIAETKPENDITTQPSVNIVYNPSDSFFKENIIWQHNNKAYTLLLHSIAINDSSISAYSVKLDTIMTFAILEPNLNFIYKKILGNSPYTPEQCVKCHSAKVKKTKNEIIKLSKSPQKEKKQSASKIENVHYTIQVAAWPSLEQARIDQLKLLEEGIDAYIQRNYRKEKNEVWYRVRIGNFSDKIKAQKMQEQIESITGVKSWLDVIPIEKK